MAARACLAAFGVLALLAPRGVVHPQQPGDTVVCFEVAPPGAGEGDNVDIYMQRLTLDGRLLWGDGGAAIALADSDDTETQPAVCDDGAGGVIVAYTYQFAEGEHAGDADIVAQRVGPDGKLLWNDGNSPVPVGSSKSQESHPVLLSDGRGGAFVVYQWMSDRGDSDLLAQRISGDGTVLWGEGQKPVAVSTSEGQERSPVIVPDGEGGIIVVFEWEGPNGDIDIMAERLSGDGQVVWNNNDQATDVSALSALERNPVAVPDGQGGAIVVFELEPTEGEAKGDVDIYAERISGEGKLLWNDGERPAPVSTSDHQERRPAAVSDGAGGVIAAFEMEWVKGEHAGDIDIDAQHLDRDGKWTWNEGKKSVTISSGPALERAVRAIPEADGGVLCAFEAEQRGGDDAGDFDLMAQRLSAGGEMAWNEGDRSVYVASSKWHERRPLVLADGEGGAIVVYPAIGAGEHEGNEDIEAARISGDGELLWNEGKQSVDLAATDKLERNPCAVVIGAR